MLIRSIRLYPFAGVADGTFQFASGLNVLFGPNEAGKSTLVNALRCILLEPCNPNKRRWDQELSRFLPRGGGDIFRVEVEFDSCDGAYRLTKQWGKQSGCQLRLPNASLVTNTVDVESRLAELLVLKPGTWDHVLFAHQNALAGTLEKLTGNAPEKHELANLLRSAVMATDGVSLEKLQQRIDQELKSLLDRWDRVLNCPEGNRGLNNRWQKGVGSIATAWYRKEQAKQELVALDTYERALTKIDEALSAQSKQCEQLQAFVNQWEPTVKAIVERRGIDARRQLVSDREARLREVSIKWPTFQERLTHKRDELKQRERTIEQLEQEFRLAEKYTSQRASIERLQRIQKQNQQVIDMTAEYEQLHPLTGEQLKTLDALNASRDKLIVQLESGKLNVALKIHGNTAVQVQLGIEPEQEFNQSCAVEANGRVVLRHPDFELQVTSGDCAFAELEQQLQSLNAQLTARLAEARCTSLAQAREKTIQSNSLAKQLTHLREALAAELKGDSMEQLQAVVGELINPPNRELSELQRELSAAQGAKQILKREIEELDSQLAHWTQEYQSLDGLLDKQIELKAEQRACERQLASLPQLPDSLGSVEAFTRLFEQKQADLRELKDHTLPALKDEKRDLGLGPEKSRADLEAETVFADTDFQQQLSRLKAMERIQQVYQTTFAQMDGNTLKPWFDGLGHFLQRLTGGSYHAIDTNAKVARRGNLELPFELLSMGTKSCLGLALRLSMAEHFLKDQTGFLLLDDPLVDLDIARRELVAELLADFAKTHQLIVFTCDAAHAELLGGQLVQVDRIY